MLLLFFLLFVVFSSACTNPCNPFPFERLPTVPTPDFSSCDLSGKVALITGASSGFGRQAALALKARGATVYGTSRYPSQYKHYEYEMLKLDYGRVAMISGLVKRIVLKEGKIDILVENGIQLHYGDMDRIDFYTEDLLNREMVLGKKELVKQVLKQMPSPYHPIRIFSTLTLSSLFAIPCGETFYTTSKFTMRTWYKMHETTNNYYYPNATIQLLYPSVYKTDLLKKMNVIGYNQTIRDAIKAEAILNFQSAPDPVDYGIAIQEMMCKGKHNKEYILAQPNDQFLPLLPTFYGLQTGDPENSNSVFTTFIESFSAYFPPVDAV